MVQQLSEWYWVFYKESTNHYIVLSDEDVAGDNRWILNHDDYQVLTDCCRSREQAEKYGKEYGYKRLKYKTRPISLREACEFVNTHHRHHVSPQGHKFSIALYDGDIVIGVIIAGRPVSRFQDNGLTLEVTRCCVKEVYKNGITKLYAAVYRVAQAMGYERIITYTLESESGVSMKAANFTRIQISKGGSWNSPSRQRVNKHPLEAKYLWELQIG